MQQHFHDIRRRFYGRRQGADLTQMRAMFRGDVLNCRLNVFIKVLSLQEKQHEFYAVDRHLGSVETVSHLRRSTVCLRNRSSSKINRSFSKWINRVFKRINRSFRNGSTARLRNGSSQFGSSVFVRTTHHARRLPNVQLLRSGSTMCYYQCALRKICQTPEGYDSWSLEEKNKYNKFAMPNSKKSLHRRD